MDDDYLMGLIAEKVISNEWETDHMFSNNTSQTSQMTPNTANEKPDEVQYNVGLDIGTMNIVSATLENNNQISAKSFRNVFLAVDSEALGTRDISTIAHTIIDDNIYILSDDAYTFGNIFGKQVSRPMSRGMISDSEIDSVDILAVIVGSLIGKAKDANSVCCYSIPANPVDSDMNVLFHQNVFNRIISQLGYKPLSLYEGNALVYSECADTDFSGIGISFGAGMTNVSIMFKGVPVLSFSLARGGDWIDTNAAHHVQGMVSNRVTFIKEKDDFDIENFMVGNKKEKRIREALSYYYNEHIRYTTEYIVDELEKVDADFPQKLPIVISGGTSRAKGFLDLIKVNFGNYEFPFEISEVRHATNPLTAVAEGCLVRSYKK